MTHDRDYYRCLHDAGLIEAGLHSGEEIAIALAERLEDRDAEGIQIDDLRARLKYDEREMGRMDDKIYELQAEIERLTNGDAHV
jgi:hypothetical protein